MPTSDGDASHLQREQRAPMREHRRTANIAALNIAGS